MPRRLLGVFAVLLVATVCACGGDDDTATAAPSDRRATTTTTAALATATTTTTAAPTTVATMTTAPPALAAATTPGAVAPGTMPPVVQSGPAVGNGVALTFDADLTPGMQAKLRDGRVESYANMAVIDILQSTDSPATIFFTGLWMEEYPDQTAAIVADPRFELATHSQTHRAFRGDCYGLATVPQAEMLDEVRVPMETLDRFTARATHYFRFPGLCHDDTSLGAIAPLGVTVVDGDASGDAGGTSAQAIVDQSLRNVHAGSIIVMHLNGGDKAGLTDDALPQIIDGLRARGLRPAPLSQVLAGS